jgi:putative transport protein
MSQFAALLSQHEILTLFCVIATGLLLSRLEFRGVKLGVAGVLFAGLGLAAFAKLEGSELKLVTDLKDFGLILFVYCVGLSSGPGFFSAFVERGLKLNLVLLCGLACGAILTFALGQLLELRRGVIAGIFCGALTNTPALGAATEVLRTTRESVDPVLGYSLTYPFGVLGALLTFRGFFAIKRRAFREETARQAPSRQSQIVSVTCVVENPQIAGHSIGELAIYSSLKVIVSRMRREQEVLVPTKYTSFHLGDLVTIVGTEAAVLASIEFFGRKSDIHLESDRETVDTRRILVSDRALAGCPISALELDRKFNAQVTRVRRADLDLVPSPDFRVLLGDRLRVVAPRKRLPEVARFFGDSAKELAEIDFMALTLGIAGGLLFGLIPFSLMGTDVTLGVAGGPLVVALLLGRRGRVGSLNFHLPFEVNQSLKQLGLLLFLAGVGISAGAALTQVLGTEALITVGLGAVVTLVTSLVTLTLSTTWGKADVVTSLGVTSGMQTQPATLGAAYELSEESEQVYVAYALVYPVAMIGKILIAQLLAALG